MAGGRWAVTLALLWLVPIVACAAGPTTISAPPPENSLTDAESRDLELLLSMVRESKLDARQRRDAVMALLDRGWPQTLLALEAELAPDGDLTTKRVIAKALVERPDGPPPALLNPLLALIGRHGPVMQEVAAALARQQDTRMTRMLTRTVVDEKATVDRRSGAILVLAHHRNQNTAGLLMQMIEPTQPPAIRDAAFVALAHLTSISEFGQDASRWQSWWQTNRELSGSQWLTMLLDNFAQRNRDLVSQQGDFEQRLLEAQRQVYRATPEDGRGALLTTMLTDPLPAMRLMAVQLTDQRLLTAGKVPEPELRTALLGRLDDPSPDIRRQAVRLLRELKDVDAADKVADYVVRNVEGDVEVMRAYLAMLARLPRVSVIDRAIQLMADSKLVPEAAGVLAAAAEQQLLSESQTTAVVDWLRRRLYQSDRVPEPQLVTLLGRVGSGDDWQWIARWLRTDDAAVRRAAAEAWANSQQPLVVLAEMGDDALIQPIVINAAIRRGRDPRTFAALVQHRPGQEQLAEAWQRAVVAVAGRVPAADVLAADQQLSAQEDTLALRAQILTAGIEQVDEPREAVDLLLARAAVRLAQNDPNQAAGDLNQLTAGKPTLNTGQHLRLQTLMSRARLASGDLDGAVLAASGVFSEYRKRNPEGWLEDSEPTIALFINAAKRSVTNNQLDQARRISTMLTQALSPGVPTSLQERIVRASQPVEPVVEVIPQPLPETPTPIDSSIPEPAGDDDATPDA